MGADLDNILYLDSICFQKEEPKQKWRYYRGMCTVANGRKETSLRHRLVTYEGFVGVLSKSGMCRNCKFPRCSWNKYLNDLTLARNNEKIQTKPRKREGFWTKPKAAGREVFKMECPV